MVKGEVAQLPETFAAAHARVRAPRCSGRMDLLMSSQFGRVAKTLPAAAAGVWPLPRVRAAVGGQLGRVAETLGAIGTFVRALRRVDPLVGGQLGAMSEALGAQGARERALPGVRTSVGSQLGWVTKTLGTVGAFIGALGAMSPLVGGQFGAIHKALATVFALIGTIGRQDSGRPPPPGTGWLGSLRGGWGRQSRGRRCLGVLFQGLRIWKEGRIFFKKKIEDTSPSIPFSCFKFVPLSVF